MRLRIMLPSLKYKDIQPGRLFVFSDCSNLFSTTNRIIKGCEIHNLYEPICFTKSFGGVFNMFDARNESEIAYKECYLVAVDGLISEIKL